MERLRLENRDNLEKAGFSKEIVAFLSQIDYAELRNIYAQEAIRSGVDPSRKLRNKDDFIGFIGIENITKRSTDNDNLITRLLGSPCAGSFKRESHVKYIDGTEVKEDHGIQVNNSMYAAQAILDKLLKFWGGEKFGKMLMGTLCHEEAHAVSYQGARVVDSEKHGRKVARMYTGYQYDESHQAIAGLDRGKAIPDLMHFFNEGVTELIAGEVYEEYLRRRAVEYKSGRTMRQLNPGSWESMAYPENQKLVTDLMNKISVECEVPPAIVWNAIKQGYYSGFDVDEWNELLSETITPGFFDELITAKQRADITSLPEPVHEHWTASLRERWRKLFSGKDG